MLLEMHCHTAEHSSCSAVSAAELLAQVYAKNLHGIVLTDHHYLWSDKELSALRCAAKVPDHFLVMSGQEVYTPELGDVLVYGATETLPYGTSLKVIRLRFPEAALVWAHPYRKGKRPMAEALLDPLIDGVEIFNSGHSVRENSRGLRDWHREKFTALAGTDTHGASYAGIYPTHFDHPVMGIQELASEIRRGRCRPFFKEIPHAGANTQVTEVTIGTKGADEVRERIIIKEISSAHKWRAAERAFRIMSAISRMGFDSGGYRVPKPIDEDSVSMTLIEQGLRGKLLFDKLLAADLEDGREYIALAAEWLAKLHGCNLRITPDDEFLEKEAIRLQRYLDRFNDVSHRHTRKAREIIEVIKAEERSIKQSYGEFFVQGHGDFHPKNIYIGQDNQDNRATRYVAAIDFESSLVLPRAFDVGCFLAQFRNQFFGSQQILQSYPEELFLDAYLKNSVMPEGDFIRQVELFRARTNMSIAAYLIKVGMGESEDLWRVLVEAERAITHL